MASSAAKTVKAYVEELPEGRRDIYEAVLAKLRKAMPKGYEEAMLWGMPCWSVPLSRYPDTYNGQPLSYVAFAAQANKFSLYLTGVYGDPAREKALRDAFSALGKKPDMGKSCVRFRQVEDIPLEAIAKLVAGMGVDECIAMHEKVHGSPRRKASR